MVLVGGGLYNPDGMQVNVALHFDVDNLEGTLLSTHLHTFHCVPVVLSRTVDFVAFCYVYFTTLRHGGGLSAS